MRFNLLKSAALSVALSLCFAGVCYAEEPQDVTITVLETSDVHGRLMNYDYAADKEQDSGLVKCATVIKQERAKDPQLFLLDCGDLCQGNMVSDFRHEKIHPAIAALNMLKYDVWELGNHEFNFEFPCTLANIKNFRGTVLGGNIYKADGTRFVKPYVIKDVKGVKVAVFGIEAPHVRSWETDPTHYDNMTFVSPMVEVGRILEELKAEKPDVIIGLCHYGENGEQGDYGMYEVAQRYGDSVDAFLIGHAHSKLLKYLNNGQWSDAYAEGNQTVLMETGSNGANVGKLTLNLNRTPAGGWKVDRRHVELLSTANAAPDPEMVEMLKDVHQASLKKASTVIGQVSDDFAKEPLWLPHIPNAVISDSAILDLIHIVQLKESGADVSVASLFAENTDIDEGAFRLKDSVKLYRYENTLMAVRITGAELKAIMEAHAGNFFNAYKKGDVTISFNPDMNLFEYDTYQGIDYEIDISKPVGHRIVNIVYKGHPLAVDEELTMCLNNYRFGQLVREGLVHSQDLVYDSANSSETPNVRSMIAKYVGERKRITPRCDKNWRIIGADLSDPQAELIYQMIREGKIEIPSDHGRRPNSKSINAIELREKGILPALK